MVKKFTKLAKELGSGGVSLGITSAVTAGVAAQAPAGTPSLTGGLGPLSSGYAIGTTAALGLGTLRMVKKYKKKKKY